MIRNRRAVSDKPRRISVPITNFRAPSHGLFRGITMSAFCLPSTVVCDRFFFLGLHRERDSIDSATITNDVLDRLKDNIPKEYLIS